MSLKDHMYFQLKENRCDSRELHRKLRLWTALYGWKTVNYQNLWYIFQIQCTQPHLETLSLWRLFSLQLLCLASALSISSHCYSVYQILKAHSSLHSTFALKVILEELFYTVVSKISLCITIICLVSACVCVCVCVCKHPSRV